MSPNCASSKAICKFGLPKIYILDIPDLHINFELLLYAHKYSMLTNVKFRLKVIKYFYELCLHMFSPFAFMFTFKPGLSTEGHEML